MRENLSGSVNQVVISLVLQIVKITDMWKYITIGGFLFTSEQTDISPRHMTGVLMAQPPNYIPQSCHTN